MPTYRIGKPHERMAEKLEAVANGDIDRLMIFAHPRIGKSELTSVRFPAWYLGRFPKRQVIACAYGGELVSGFGARLRNLVGSQEHSEVFGEEAGVQPDVRARDLWYTKAGGVYRAAGVGGAITGFGAHILIIDDPVKSRMDAASPTIQRNNWSWYQAEAYTRLMRPSEKHKGGAIVICQTRWHEEDISGKLLRLAEIGDGDQWEVLHMPAIDEAGNAAWPEEFPVERLKQIRSNVGPVEWQAQWQGDPVPEDGDFFKAEWFQPSPVRFLPRDAKNGAIRVYAASDYAVSDSEGDYTVHVVAGVDEDDNLHVLDLWRGQTTPDIWTEAMIDMALKWEPINWGEGKGGMQRAVEPYIAKRQAERRAYFARVQIPETTDKATRAQAFQGRMAMRKVFWPENAPWYAETRSEMIKFPNGRHDDIVDALSILGRMIHGMAHGSAPPGPPPKPAQMVIGSGSKTLPGLREATWNDIIASTKRLRKRMKKRRWN